MCVWIQTRRFFANRLFIVASYAPCDTYTTQSYLSLSLCLCVCLFAFYISFSNRDDACQFWCSIKRFDYSKFLIITISTPLFCFRCFFCDKSLILIFICIPLLNIRLVNIQQRNSILIYL